MGDSTTNYPVDSKIAAFLAADGIRIVGRPLAQPLSQDILRQFDLVILTTFMGLRAPWFALGDKLADYYTLKRNVAEIRAYVEAGGGLFFTPEFGWAGTEAAETMGELLEPWGIRVNAASPYDKAHAWQTYGWTENVSRSPATRGVTRLFYPMINGRWDDLYPTTTLTLQDSKRWKAVIRGMPGSVTAKNIPYGETPGWYPLSGMQDPPVLAATAEIGQGHVAVLTIAPLYTLSNAYQDPKVQTAGEFTTGPIDGVVAEKGDGRNPSQGRELLRSMLRWAGEPAAARGLGRYSPEGYAKTPTPPQAEVPTWLNGWNATNGSRLFKTLIGARSAYSDGKGTIAEYAAAARTNGYSILVMTETFEKFPPEKWGSFYRDCAAASSPDLLVLPGIEIPDSYGSRYLLFGQSVFPQAFMLTENQKAIRQDSAPRCPQSRVPPARRAIIISTSSTPAMSSTPTAMAGSSTRASPDTSGRRRAGATRSPSSSTRPTPPTKSPARRRPDTSFSCRRTLRRTRRGTCARASRTTGRTRRGSWSQPAL